MECKGSQSRVRELRPVREWGLDPMFRLLSRASSSGSSSRRAHATFVSNPFRSLMKYAHVLRRMRSSFSRKGRPVESGDNGHCGDCGSEGAVISSLYMNLDRCYPRSQAAGCCDEGIDNPSE